MGFFLEAISPTYMHTVLAFASAGRFSFFCIMLLHTKVSTVSREERLAVGLYLMSIPLHAVIKDSSKSRGGASVDRRICISDD